MQIAETAAVNYWSARLAHQIRIPRPQHPECRYAVVVPVYAERLDRLLLQLDSLQCQQNLSSQEYEVLYVVNNAPPDGSQQRAKAIAANQSLIASLPQIIPPNVFVIDCSSPGCEIPDCNVGRARNRGVAEASLRFHEQGKNGVLIQIDADTYFADREYFIKLNHLLAKNPDVIGMAGGLVFEFSPDSQDESAVELIRRKLELLSLWQRWEYIGAYLQQIAAGHGDRLILHFSGAHMISRSYETALVGGLKDLAQGEDPVFGQSLMSFAQERGGSVIDVRDELTVVTALRESQRTSSSFGYAFQVLDLEQTLMVKDFLAVASGETPTTEVALTPERYRELEARLMDLPNGSVLIARLERMAARIQNVIVHSPTDNSPSLWRRWLKRLWPLQGHQ